MKTTSLCNAALLCSGLAVLALTDSLSAQRGGGRGNAAERTTRLVEQFDADGKGYLDAGERAAAREWLRENRPAGRGRGGGRGRRRGGRGGRGRGGGRGGQTPPPELPKTFVAKDEVTYYPDHELYDNTVLRTIFLDFPQEEWMAELDDFYRTDVEVPATMTVDGVTYEGVGTGFRGNSSYFGARGPKKSMNITTDFINPEQRLYGYKTFNLLSGHADQSFLREVIHSEVGNRYFPVLKANLVKLVINGENWGVYINVQQYNKDFLADAYDTKRGVRWKIPSGRGGALTYQGDERAAYERSYQLKSNLSGEDEEAAWRSLIALCRLLESLPDQDLVGMLPKFLDIDVTLWFMAMEFTIMDGDGYFSRGSDYTLYQDRYGRFRPVLYDSNEILGRSSGRGGGGARPATVESPPLAMADVEGRPLARLFTVSAWRARYLAHVHTLAMSGMDWSTLGPFVEQQAAMIDAEVKIDDKALYGYDRFVSALVDLESIVTDRRDALLGHESLSGPWPVITEVRHTEWSAGDEAATVNVRANVRDDVAASSVILYISDRLTRPYTAISMYDDGAHGDGSAGDGIYGAEAGTFDVGDDLLIYVEARADGDKTTFHPAGAEGRPMVIEVGKG